MDITALIAHGGAGTVTLFVMALLLGALHGLEPGHSKTMMAAYIVAVRGTAFEAVLLGVSAAVSHSIVVWVLAILGLLYGDDLIAEEMEPVFMTVSGGIFLAIALWFFLRLRGERRAAGRHGHPHRHRGHVSEDAHARAHAADIEQRLAQGRTGILQTVAFGLTGGLIPCPAAITVLILCLNIGQFWRGVTLVSAFSIGLALTLVAVGAAAALGARMASRGTAWFDRAVERAPYASSALIAILGLLMVYSGWSHATG